MNNGSKRAARRAARRAGDSVGDGILTRVLGPDHARCNEKTLLLLATPLFHHFDTMVSAGEKRMELSLQFPNGEAEVILAIGEEAEKIRAERRQFQRETQS